MTRNLIAYAAIALVMLALDMLWLGLIARAVYQQGIGHLMAERPNVPVAMLFYVVYAAGLLVFAVLPNAAEPGWAKTAVSAALFGFFAYATYDLSNLATLKGWPIGMSLLDMAWGSAASAVSGVAGKATLARWAAG